eukprot:1190501-Prorocentrum_minimum.AAC.2
MVEARLGILLSNYSGGYVVSDACARLQNSTLLVACADVLELANRQKHGRRRARANRHEVRPLTLSAKVATSQYRCHHLYGRAACLMILPRDDNVQSTTSSIIRLSGQLACGLYSCVIMGDACYYSYGRSMSIKRRDECKQCI